MSDFPDDGLSVAVASAVQDLKSRCAYATLFFFCDRLRKKRDFSVVLPTQPRLNWSGPTTPRCVLQIFTGGKKKKKEKPTCFIQNRILMSRVYKCSAVHDCIWSSRFSVSVRVVSCYFISCHFFSFLVNFDNINFYKDCSGLVELIGFIRANQKSNWTAPSFGRWYPATNNEDFSK